MKKIILLSMLVSVFGINVFSQPFHKGNILLGTGVQVATLLAEDRKFDSTNALPFITNFEYIFFAKGLAQFGIGAKAELYKSMLNNQKYFDAKIGVPLNLHVSLFKRFDTYLGYCIYGHYYSVDNPSAYYEYNRKWTLNSEMYLGFQYFLTSNFGLYTRFATNGLRVSAGTTYKF